MITTPFESEPTPPNAARSLSAGFVARRVIARLAVMAIAMAIMTTALDGQAPASLAGTWSGKIETPAGSIGIVVRLQQGNDGVWSATIDIPQQGAKGIQLLDVAVRPPEVSFRIPGAPGDPTIRVTAEGGVRMSGTLTQGGGTVPVSLARGEPRSTERPQVPARPFPYDEEEVTFRNEAAAVQLTGTLTRPRSTAKVPAVLLISGSGQQDRDETLFDHKPFLLWADYLTRRGIAVLRVDDRGVGGSSRGSATATSDDFAGDVRAGVAFLLKRPDIDGAKVGLVGHSEGAMLAAMVAASTSDVSFVVMLAGTGLPGDRILLSQASLLLHSQGASEAAITWDRSIRERVLAVLKAETDGQPNQALRQKLLDDVGGVKDVPPGTPDGAAARTLAETLFKVGSQPWLRFFVAFDPRPTLSKVRCPVLAIGGDRDVQVPVRDNLPEIERALRSGGNKDVTVATLPNLNHLLQTSTTGMPNEYATIEETISPTALQLVSDWIVKRTS